LTKRKRRVKKSRPAARPPRQRRPSPELEAALRRAEGLIDRGRFAQAIELLEPFLGSQPRVVDLYFYYGYACYKAGDLWEAVEAYEQAMTLSRDREYWQPLASLYMGLELNAHALNAFRQMLRLGVDAAPAEEVGGMIAFLEQEIEDLAGQLQISMAQAERGLRYHEEGIRALQSGDFQASIAANRRAIKLLPNWPPPRNNLSQALFFDGRSDEAIASARQVLSMDPQNVQAVAHTIRFLVWAGQEEQARDLWPRLKALEPEEATARFKVAEAAAILGEDQRVYDLLKPLDRSEAIEWAVPELRRSVQWFLAVAEANLGKRTARGRLKVLQNSVHWARDLLRALEAGRPGPGWADRFPYFHSTEMVTRRRMEEFVELISRKDRISPRKFESEMARFVARVPQLVLVAEKLIWEENGLEAGVGILKTVGTPAAYAALRRFGLSQAGDDKARMDALYALLEVGEIPPDETLRVWARGEWQEVQLRRYEISEESRSAYSDEVADLLNDGLDALQQGEDRQAEQRFRRALELDPHAKEAYNNLGTIYARRGQHEQAREMLLAALDVDPLYVLPRCNLATYLLDDDDVDGAMAMLKPLSGVTRFSPQEMAFYYYVQARVSMHQDDLEAAERSLEAALEVWPGYELAEEQLKHLKLYSMTRASFGSFFERQRQRDQAWRARLQARLSTPEPGLSQALSLYTKEVYTGMARVIMPYGGWSALRKAELLDELMATLQDADNVARIVAGLDDTERGALRQVLAHGGHMAWQAFDAEFGNDLEESRYWQYHEPETTMGRLRLRGLLVEATVDGELLVAVPLELRQPLEALLGRG